MCIYIRIIYIYIEYYIAGCVSHYIPINSSIPPYFHAFHPRIFMINKRVSRPVFSAYMELWLEHVRPANHRTGDGKDTTNMVMTWGWSMWFMIIGFTKPKPSVSILRRNLRSWLNS